jgi:hypothetical protein
VPEHLRNIVQIEPIAGHSEQHRSVCVQRGELKDCRMLAALATLVLFAFTLVTLAEILRRDGLKILAALKGHSWISEPNDPRPMTVRFSQRYPVAQPLQAQPALRAAA